MTVTGSENYSVAYAYDLNDRLLSETKNEAATGTVTEYHYDNNGNRIASNTGKFVNAGSGDGRIAVSEYSDDVWLYGYDGFNRLVSAFNGLNASRYTYRPDGLRDGKTVNGVKTTQVWEGGSVGLELNSSNQVIGSYVRGVNLIKSGNGGYYLYNAHGDVVQLADGSGSITKNYHYDAFGNEISADPNDSNPFRYCGEYFDKETGSVYLRARYYDPSIGRFLTEDPSRSGLNWYAYCAGNPIALVDPSGLVEVGLREYMEALHPNCVWWDEKS
jgi:RHS repeat-associated protein